VPIVDGMNRCDGASALPAVQSSSEPVEQRRAIVAVVLSWHGRIGLFKRSASVGGGAGLWHCITGYLDEAVDPRDQALAELQEETGLCGDDLVALDERGLLVLPDASGAIWKIHAFTAETNQRRLVLNWEHIAYRWVRPQAVARFDGQVPWLRDVLAAAA